MNTVNSAATSEVNNCRDVVIQRGNLMFEGRQPTGVLSLAVRGHHTLRMHGGRYVAAVKNH